MCLDDRAAYHLKSLLDFKHFPKCLGDSCNRLFFNTENLFAHLNKVPEHKMNGNHIKTLQVVSEAVTSFIENEHLDIHQKQVVNEYTTGNHLIVSSIAGAGKSKVHGENHNKYS